jgi:hypothetical protein
MSLEGAYLHRSCFFAAVKYLSFFSSLPDKVL